MQIIDGACNRELTIIPLTYAHFFLNNLLFVYDFYLGQKIDILFAKESYFR